jgi:DNA-binding PadR family transcriptional regulator
MRNKDIDMNPFKTSFADDRSGRGSPRAMRGGGRHGGHHGRGLHRAIDDGDFGGGRRGRGGRGGGGMGGGGGRGGMRRGRLFAREELRLMVLALLAEGPQHGYQLMRAFEEKAGGAYVPSPGVLYPLLAMLEELGEVESTPAEDGKRRQVALTDTGRAALDTGKAVADTALARLAALAAATSRADVAPVRRAMTNLKTALADRLGRDGGDGEIGFAIAAVLDEAAQKIERLQIERPLAKKD